MTRPVLRTTSIRYLCTNGTEKPKSQEKILNPLSHPPKEKNSAGNEQKAIAFTNYPGLFFCIVLMLLNLAAFAQTTYSYTGAVQTATVPAGVTSVTVDVKGAQGNPAGGKGGRVQATLAVTAGQTLNIYVGGQAGWNGGGTGNSNRKGGGASDIRISGTGLTDRVIVAGGGGGGNNQGGGGGGTTGGTGGGNGDNPAALGGTPSAGGAGAIGTGGLVGSSGSLGTGGNADLTYNGPGGGGGGYYGGGGGAWAGGGGGSSYTNSTYASSVTHTQGYQSGDGEIIITWPNTPPGFVNGNSQTLSVCQNASAVSINNLLSVNDANAGQTETWSVTSAASQGTVSASYSTTSTGSTLTPTGLTYTPTNGYTGTDAFTVQVSDGAATASTVVNVTINPAPTSTFSVTGGGSYCSGGSGVAVGLSGSQTDVKYQLFVGASTPGSPVTGTGSPISFGNKTTGGTYTVVGTNTNTGCTATMTGSQIITVNPLPTITLGTSPTITQGTTSASLPYAATTNSPTTYTITWSATSLGVGFTNISSPASLSSSPIQISVPVSAPANTYVGAIRVQNTTCNSSSVIFTVTVNSTNAAPAFTNGSSQTLSVCQNAGATSVNNLLTVNDADADAGQTETWNVTSDASHGTVSAAYSTTSTGGTLTPTGLTYSPNAGYSGTDAFTVQVSDGTATATTTINVTVNAVTASLAITNVACNGGTTGSATITTSGGTSPYTYAWSPSGGTGATASSLAAGMYSCMVSDSKGCTINKTGIIVTEPAVLKASSATTNNFCNGGSAGDRTTTVSDGTAPFTYTWSNGATVTTNSTSHTISRLIAGTYSCTVTDAHGCTAFSSYDVTDPPALMATTSQTNTSANGAADGSATITVSGGTGQPSQFDYLWSPSGGRKATATSLAAGTYSCTVTDVNGCTITKKCIITAPSTQVQASQCGTVLANISTNILADNIASATQYRFRVINGANVQTIDRTINSFDVTMLASYNYNTTYTIDVAVETAGTWSVYGSACTITTPSNHAPTDISLSATSINENVAADTKVGDFTATDAEGGTMEYSMISGAGSDDNSSFTIAGNNLQINSSPDYETKNSYKIRVRVTDDGGLTYDKPFVIIVNDLPEMILSPSSLPAATVGVDYNAQLSASAGIPLYTYAVTTGSLPSGLSLSSGGTLTGTPTTAGSSDFAVTVTDNKGASASQAYSLPVYSGNQTISLASTSSATYGDTDFEPGATSTNSTIPVVYSSADNSIATIINKKVHIVKAGTVIIYANQSSDNNYNAAVQQSQTLTIGKRTINVTAHAQAKIYGDVDPDLDYTYSPALIGSDAFSGALTRDNGEAVASYDITLGSLALNDNYTLNYAGSKLVIGKKTINVTADAKSKMYGDGDPMLTYTSAPALIGGDAFSGTLTRISGESVASYDIYQGSLALNDNYTLSFTGSKLAIGKKTITVTAKAQSKMYGDADPALTYSFTPEPISGDNFTGFLSRVSGEDVASYAIHQGSLALSGNYSIKYTGADLVIGKKTITVTANAQSKAYGDADPALTYIVTPALIAPDNFTGALSRTSGENAASYTINQGSLALNSNYSIKYTGADFVIGKKTITVIANGQSKAYGDNDPVLNYTFTPALFAGDDFTGVLLRESGEDVASYNINKGSLALSNNYTLNFTGAKLTIGKKTITVTANAQSKTYGDTDPALTYTFTPTLITGDDFTGALSRTSGEDVASYNINKGSLALNDNYTLDYAGSKLVIGKKTINVTADAKSKMYGDADPMLTYTSAPALVGSDAFSGTLIRVSGEDVASYDINLGSLVLNDNYALNYTGAQLGIGKKTITLTANAQSKTYGDIDPALTYSFTPALIGGDAFTGALSRTSGENVASYDIKQGSLALNDNYTLHYTGAQLVIGKKKINVTAEAQTKVYGDADPTLTYKVTGFVNGDNNNVMSGALNRQPGEDVAQYSILQNTLGAGNNYAINYTGDMLTITKASQSITWNQQLVTGCNGAAPIQLAATANSGLPVTYIVSNTSVGTVNGNMLTPVQPGITTIKASQAGDGNHFAATDAINTYTYLSAGLVQQHFSDALFFVNESSRYISWQWYKNNTAVSGATNPYYSETAALNGSYYVAATDKNGNTINTCPLVLTGNSVVLNKLKVSPNPVTRGTMSTITCDYTATALQGAKLIITSMSGTIIKQFTTVQPSVQTAMPQTGGLYTISLILSTGEKQTVNVVVR